MPKTRENSIRLAYITPLSFPSRYINRLQVMKMSEAFSRVSDFCLSVADANDTDALFDAYNTKPFCLKVVGTSRWWPRSFFLALLYRRRIAQLSSDTVFYCRDILLAFFLSFVSARFRGGFFFELHSLGALPSWTYARVLKNARGVITTNAAKRDAVVERFGVSPERVLVFGNGIDLEEIERVHSNESLTGRLGLSGGVRIVLYTGSIDAEQGLETFIAAAESAPDDTAFVAVGGTAEDHGRLAGTRGFGRVHFLPRVPREEVLSYMKEADVLVAPYSGESERNRLWRSPIKLKEYMASGTPIITSRLPAIEEIVSDDEAFLIVPDDSQALTDEVREVLSNKEAAALRAAAAKERVKQYSWDRRAEAILSFIEGILNND